MSTIWWLAWRAHLIRGLVQLWAEDDGALLAEDGEDLVTD